MTVGLVTCDESLVERIGRGLASSGIRIVVGSTPTVAQRMLQERSPCLCILDEAFEFSPSPLVPMHKGDGLILHFRYPEAPDRGYSAASFRYRRDALQQLVRHLDSFCGGSDIRHSGVGGILGQSSAITLVREQIRSVSRFAEVPVLILGETGTGKERVAHALHETTFGPDAPFVAINCAAIPESLLESELFGHEAGAYTGARGIKVGLFEAAGNGTIFLDEIGEMAPTMQPKLLRVLESREYRRIGSNRTLQLRARIISATNRNPWVSPGAEIRSDLTYRLAGFSIRLPPLRERTEDIEPLTHHFVSAFRERYGMVGVSVSAAAMALLRVHEWPGNVRELRAVVEHACIVCRQGCVGPEDVRAALAAHGRPGQTAAVAAAAPRGVPTFIEVDDSGGLRDIERSLIFRALQQNEGNVSRTARQLGLPRSTLRSKLKRLESPMSGATDLAAALVDA